MRINLIDIELNPLEYVLSKVFRKYTYKIYKKGVKDGFNWKN